MIVSDTAGAPAVSAAPYRPASCPAVAELSHLTESEQVAEAVRLSLLGTSGADSPPPPEPDWPSVAPPPADWCEAAAVGQLAALEEALLTEGEAVLLLSAEKCRSSGLLVRLEARHWLQMKPETRWQPAAVAAPRSRYGDANVISQDWNVNWDSHTSPSPVTSRPFTPRAVPSAIGTLPHRGPPPASDFIRSSGPFTSGVPIPPPRAAEASPPPPPVVTLLSNDDGSPTLPSQKPNKRRKLSPHDGKRKIELPWAAPGTEAVVITEALPVGAHRWYHGDVTSNQKTWLSPPPQASPAHGVTRRPSSEDLFTDESLFARVDVEPPAFVDEPTASLGFQPAPSPVTSASTTAAATETAMETGSDSRQGWDELPADHGGWLGRQADVPAAVAVSGQQKAGGVRLLEAPTRMPAGPGRETAHQIRNGTDDVQLPGDATEPAPSATRQPPIARRRHPSSQPLFDFGFDDDVLFAGVVTPPQPLEAQLQSLPAPEELQLQQSPQEEPRLQQSPLETHSTGTGGAHAAAAATHSAAAVPGVRQLADAADTVSSPLMCPPLLARTAVSIRGSPAAGASIYSTTQLLELVDQSVASPVSGRTPARRLNCSSTPPQAGAPAGQSEDEQGGRRHGTGPERRPDVDGSREAWEKADGATNSAAAVAATPASQRADSRLCDLFADFFEDNDLFKGVPSCPADKANSVATVDLMDSTTSAEVARPAQRTEAATTSVSSAPDSPLFTVTRPRSQTPNKNAVGSALGASPAVSPILSSQRRPRDEVTRRYSTPLSVRGPHRLSRLKQRYSTPLAASVPVPASASAVFVGDDDLWAEAECGTPRRSAARALCLTSGSARTVSWLPESPLARSTRLAPGNDSAMAVAASGAVDKNSALVHRPASTPRDAVSPVARPLCMAASTESTLDKPTARANGTDRVPVVLLSRVPDPRARPGSRANGTDSSAALSHSVANDTDSPIGRRAGVRRRRPAILMDSENDAPPAGWLREDVGHRETGQGREETEQESGSHGESTGLPAPCRDSSSESVIRPGPCRDSSSESVIRPGPCRDSSSESVIRPGPCRDSSSESVIRPGPCRDSSSESVIRPGPCRDSSSESVIRRPVMSKGKVSCSNTAASFHLNQTQMH